MKPKTIIVLLLISILIATLPVFSTTKDGFSVIDQLIDSNFSTKHKVLRHVRQNYPDLGKTIIGFIKANYPRMPSRMKAERARYIAENYPELPVKLPRIVLEELSRDNPDLIMDVAVDVSTLIFEKYPTLPYDLMRWRSREKIRSKIHSMISSKHPRLLADMGEVLISKGYTRELKLLKAEIIMMLAEKHPDLKANVMLDIVEVVQSKYPELPGKISQIREDPTVNPRFAIREMICKQYPQFIPDVLKKIRDNNGQEVQQALIDVLTLIEEKNPTLIAEIHRDLSAMITEKHPELLTDLASIKINCRYNVVGRVRKKYPHLGDDMANLFQEKYPDLGQRIVGAIDKNFPGLRKEMVSMRRSRFKTFTTAVMEEVNRKYPNLLGEIDKMTAK